MRIRQRNTSFVVWRCCYSRASFSTPSESFMSSPNAAPVVFLVGQSQDDTTVYARYLREHGCITVEIDTTDEAFQRCPEADIIVTDIDVRGTFDGVELVRRIRHSECTTPIIVLTASATKSDSDAARDVGASQFIAKPCGPDELLRSIRRWLNSPSR
jgi:CheY-like chemotaxis protein